MSLFDAIMAAKLAAKMAGGNGSGGSSGGVECYPIFNGEKNNIDGGAGVVIPVASLPAVGVPYANVETDVCTIYLRTSDLTTHFYIDETITELMGVPVGWYAVADTNPNGDKVISSPEEATETDVTYIVYNAGSSSAGGGVSSWNDLTDKPFGEESIQSIVCPVSEQTVDFSGSLRNPEHKISDLVLTPEQLCGATLILKDRITITLDSEGLVEFEGGFRWGTSFKVIYDTHTVGYSSAGLELEWPSTGMYYGGQLSKCDAELILPSPIEVVKPIDEKYIPDTIARKSDIPESIIDVDTLPTENINANAFYRTVGEAYTLYNGEKNAEDGVPITIHIVDSLPSQGEVYADSVVNPTKYIYYLQTSDLTVHAYIDEALSDATNGMFPVGWQSMAENLAREYAVISTEAEATEENVLYVIYTAGGLFAHNGTEWVEYVTKAQLDEAVANAGSSGGKLYRHTISARISTAEMSLILWLDGYSYSSEQIKTQTEFLQFGALSEGGTYYSFDSTKAVLILVSENTIHPAYQMKMFSNGTIHCDYINADNELISTNIIYSDITDMELTDVVTEVV